LLVLYGLSLISELLCNDRPLYVRYRGRSYFPVCAFYPEGRFTGNGSQARPDYLGLRGTAAFAPGSGNFMIFPPVPHSPYGSADPDSLARAAKVTLTFTPLPRVGTVDIRRDLTVARSVNCGYFFDGDDAAPAGVAITNVWPLPGDLQRAVDARFANRPAPAIEVAVARQGAPARTATACLSAFAPRRQPPATVRLTLRESLVRQRKQSVAFGLDGKLQKSRSPLWNGLPDGERARLTGLVRQAAAGPPVGDRLEVGGLEYRVAAEKAEVRWPYPPLRGHWMGLDSAGRDVLARILYGLRTSLSFGLLLVVVTMVLGALIGAVQGYYAGKIDITAQRLIEVWVALPFLYVMILIGSVYGRSFWLLLFCYGIFNWIGVSYYIRAEFLRLRRMPFVESAVCMGVRPRRIILRHIMPNALTPLITLFPFSLVGAIYSLTALDYLGFGLPPPEASWGDLLQQAQQFRWAWWLILYPSLALFVVMLLGVFIGEGLRDAYDPRKYSRLE